MCPFWKLAVCIFCSAFNKLVIKEDFQGFPNTVLLQLKSIQYLYTQEKPMCLSQKICININVKQKGIWELDYLAVLRNVFKGVLNPRDNPLMSSSSSFKWQKEVMLLAFSSVESMKQMSGHKWLYWGSPTLIVTPTQSSLVASIKSFLLSDLIFSAAKVGYYWLI